MVEDAHGSPPGLTVGHDDEGLYVAAEDGDDDEKYHLDGPQLTAVMRHGWAVALDDIVDALGVRATLDAARAWQAEMDRIIAERDPWVTFDDSIAAGNCRIGTQSFVNRFRAEIGAKGEIGAARASVILRMRDDAYTRRAARVAAQRTLDR
jgi:hypothetical protein